MTTGHTIPDNMIIIDDLHKPFTDETERHREMAWQWNREMLLGGGFVAVWSSYWVPEDAVSRLLEASESYSDE